MKNFKLLLLVLSLSALSGFRVMAQENMEDVIYLKNGNVYRGLIIEQVPNVSMKIQTYGGNIFSVAISDVEKITKEKRIMDEREFHPRDPFYEHPRYPMDSLRKKFPVKRRGYFFQSQLLIENLQGGVRIVNGYKFNRFAYLGVGIGVDRVFSAPYTHSNIPLSRNDYAGFYFPLYLYYSGDFFNKRITPFYALEAGYAMGPGNTNFDNGTNFGRQMRGGAMGSLGLGVKINTRRRVNLSLLMNMNFKQTHFTRMSSYIDVFGKPYDATEKVEAFLLFPGIRFGIGF